MVGGSTAAPAVSTRIPKRERWWGPRPDVPGAGPSRPEGPLGGPPRLCAQHGRLLGGGSPLGEEVVLTPSRRQGRHREVGSGGSPRQDLGTEEHEPCTRRTGRVSLHGKVKPVTAKRASA